MQLGMLIFTRCLRESTHTERVLLPTTVGPGAGKHPSREGGARPSAAGPEFEPDAGGAVRHAAAEPAVGPGVHGYRGFALGARTAGAPAWGPGSRACGRLGRRS